MSLKTTLKAPLIPSSIPAQSQWLAGEGAGSWFSIMVVNHQYKICRYSPEGNIECEGVFTPNKEFNIELPYQFVHISHCQIVTILQNNNTIVFERISS